MCSWCYLVASDNRMVIYMPQHVSTVSPTDWYGTAVRTISYLFVFSHRDALLLRIACFCDHRQDSSENIIITRRHPAQPSVPVLLLQSCCAEIQALWSQNYDTGDANINNTLLCSKQSGQCNAMTAPQTAGVFLSVFTTTERFVRCRQHSRQQPRCSQWPRVG